MTEFQKWSEKWTPALCASLVGVSMSKRESCTLRKTGDRADVLIWLHKGIEEKGFEIHKYPTLRDLLS